MSKKYLCPGIHHVGINVSNMMTSLAFYRDLLGLSVIWEDRLEGEKGFHAVVLLTPDSATQLELVSYPENSAISHLNLTDRSLGINHVCFEVHELDKIYGLLQGNGKGVLGPIEDDPANGVKFFYARDPDGTILEFMQVYKLTLPENFFIMFLAYLLLYFLGRKARKQFHCTEKSIHPFTVHKE
jgi:methylmalonyl-CoA/ethylmalonyl-CoA epimerase